MFIYSFINITEVFRVRGPLSHYMDFEVASDSKQKVKVKIVSFYEVNVGLWSPLFHLISSLPAVTVTWHLGYSGYAKIRTHDLHGVCYCCDGFWNTFGSSTYPGLLTMSTMDSRHVSRYELQRDRAPLQPDTRVPFQYLLTLKPTSTL